MLLGKLRRLRDLSNGDRRLLLRIALMTPSIEICLRFFGFKRTLGWVRFLSRPGPRAVRPAAEVERHRRLVHMFQRNLPYTGRCLARALTLWSLLLRRGIKTDVRFGMRKRDGKLLGHAWIEYDGRPLMIETFNASSLLRIFEAYCRGG